jgi:transcriptional regulator with XRE-family HTH domain
MYDLELSSRPMSQIKKRREAAGLTQAQLARAMGVSEVTVQKWETGTRKPRSTRLKKLASALRCKAADLIGDLV